MLKRVTFPSSGGHGPDEGTTVEAPFVVEHRREAGRGGDFVPSARLVLTPALRTSGLWGALPAEELKDLLLVLTYLTPNGWLRPALPELAGAMGTSSGTARDRLRRLARRQWRGGPVAVELPSGGGPEAYAPGNHLIAHEHGAAPQERGQAPPARTAGREAVLEYSRARYARTRQEVESEISQRMGWAPPAFAGEDPAMAERKRAAYTAMTDLGVAKEQALDLLARFDLERVERQVGWIGHRNAKNPGRYLAAAVKGDYEMPLGLRARQAPQPASGDALADNGEPGGARHEQDGE